MSKTLLQTLNSSLQILQPSTPPHSQTQTTQTHHLTPTPTAPSTLKQHYKLSRRELAIRGVSSPLLLLLGTYAIDPFHLSKARADDELTNSNKGEIEEDLKSNSCTGRSLTKKAFFDISIDGEPVGRIIVGLYGANAPIGTSRFSSVVSGAAGISYRRKEFVKIVPNYIQHGGLRSYGVDVELANNTGSNLVIDNLVEEWEKENERCPGTKNLAGSLSIIVRDPSKPPPNLKLVARNGKLQIDKEEVGTAPNGTEFVITIKDSPELDASTLLIGRVLDGMEVVERISKVKTVQENTSSPYFRVAKLIGDKRAVVAERGFNRPYSKILVANCGLIN
ncbi:cyclophilin-like peptidyl-prolyl cis-trans isomerase family protein [Tasmannia lanceolata]|uniref:cyclophilin-like peptidyl-prolyl cis-trans isomerase family protein n=1 Tax=Tasmannia lanceolata TaxID=3420 RepID=UPI00406310A1